MSRISKELLKAIAVTAELTGTEISPDAARMFADDLSQYPEEQVMKALTRCRRELKTRMSLADVISRIDDGRPGAEEAWAMIPKDESGSVVWTTEMAEAFGVAYKLIEQVDTVQARMAFIETYRDRCAKARDASIPVKWIPSLGHDPLGREHVLMDAVEKGRLTAQHVAGLLPYRAGSDGSENLLINNNSSKGFSKLPLTSSEKFIKQISSHSDEEVAKKRLAECHRILEAKTATELQRDVDVPATELEKGFSGELVKNLARDIVGGLKQSRNGRQVDEDAPITYPVCSEDKLGSETDGKNPG